MNRIRSLLCLAALACWPSAASAQQAQLELVGRISPSCSVELPDSEALALTGLDLSRDGRAEVRLDVHCNTDFEAAVHSSNGGMRNHFAEQARWTGGETVFDYRLQMSVTGGPVSEIATASSTAGRADALTLRAPRPQNNGGVLVVMLDWDSSLKHFAGRHDDVIEVNVQPAH